MVWVDGCESFQECLLTGSSKATSCAFLTEKSTVITPPGVDLEGGPTVLLERYLNSTFGIPYLRHLTMKPCFRQKFPRFRCFVPCNFGGVLRDIWLSLT